MAKVLQLILHKGKIGFLSNREPQGYRGGLFCHIFYKMTRLDLVNLVKERLGLSQAESLRVTEEVFSAISSILKEQGRLELRGFGTFLKKVRKARIGRIISLNKPIKVPGYKTVVFVPGKDLKRITLQPLK